MNQRPKFPPTRLPMLRVKINSLAEEAKIIRKAEQKYLGYRGQNYLRLRDDFCIPQGKAAPVEELDGETRRACREDHKRIRLELRQARKRATTWIYEDLNGHRTGEVRREARCAQLASGFIRGHSYEHCEACGQESPDFTRIKVLVVKFGVAWSPEISGDEFEGYVKDQRVRFDAWVADAKEVLAQRQKAAAAAKAEKDLNQLQPITPQIPRMEIEVEHAEPATA